MDHCCQSVNWPVTLSIKHNLKTIHMLLSPGKPLLLSKPIHIILQLWILSNAGSSHAGENTSLIFQIHAHQLLDIAKNASSLPYGNPFLFSLVLSLITLGA